MSVRRGAPCPSAVSCGWAKVAVSIWWRRFHLRGMIEEEKPDLVRQYALF